MTNELTDLSATVAQARDVLNAFQAAVKRANVEKPTKQDRAELDRLLRDFPQLWDLCGDMMAQAAHRMFDSMQATYTARATFKTAWVELPKTLARPTDGKLEGMLIQHAVLCWLQLSYVEHHYAHYLTSGETTIKHCDFWERRLSATQRRYLRAIETLARVRRLQVPAVQVNIGAQQVNQVNGR